MSYHKEQLPNQESLRPLSQGEQEEIIINALENQLHRLALGRHTFPPRWSVW